MFWASTRKNRMKTKSVGRARCILICIWEKFASPPSNLVKVWVGAGQRGGGGLPLYLNEFLFISISPCRVRKVVGPFLCPIGCIIYRMRILIVREAKEKLRRNQNLPRRPLTEPGSPDKRAQARKKVNFVVSNKKCKCCESVKRTMGKWGRTKQNKTVKERKIKWNESRVEILPDLPVSFEYLRRRSLKRLWRFAGEEFWLD